MRKLILAAAVAVACAATAAPAMAGSIAYIKDGNVWLSTDDGSRQFQVTTSGGYMDVSQADDGTMIALTGVRLHKLDRLGNVLADFDTPVSDTRPPGSRVFYGPFDPAISPDGQKVAYIYYYMTQSQDPGCYPPECVTTINEGGTGYTRSDRQTAWDENGFRKHSGWRNPTWVDNDTTLLSDPTHLPNHDVVVDVPAERTGGGYMAKNWFSDTVDGNPGMGGGDITRDKRKLAYVTGEADSTLTFYAVSEFPTAFPDGEAPQSTKPTVCYRYSDPIGGKFATPTFSPSGAQAAFAVGDGIHVVDVPDFSAGCSIEGASQQSRLLIPGGIQPDWGPADVPASRPAQNSGANNGQQGGGQQQGGQQQGGGAPQQGTPKLALTAVKLRRALAKGLAVKLTGATAGTVKLVARYRGKVVAKASGTVAADGTLAARLKFSKAARKKLKRMAKVKLAVSGGGASATIVLKR